MRTKECATVVSSLHNNPNPEIIKKLLQKGLPQMLEVCYIACGALTSLLSTPMGVDNIDVGFYTEVQLLVTRNIQFDLNTITSISFHKASYLYNATTSKSFHKNNKSFLSQKYKRGPYQV